MLSNPARLPSLLSIIRTNLFPNNTMGQGRIPPTEAEVLEIKTRCASTIAGMIPEFARSRLFASHDSAFILSQVEEMLDCFGDSYTNKHLLFAIVDLVVLRLFPEIRDQGISVLLDDI
jgi:hypothetical protein